MFETDMHELFTIDTPTGYHSSLLSIHPGLFTGSGLVLHPYARHKHGSYLRYHSHGLGMKHTHHRSHHIPTQRTHALRRVRRRLR